MINARPKFVRQLSRRVLGKKSRGGGCETVEFSACFPCHFSGSSLLNELLGLALPFFLVRPRSPQSLPAS